MEPTVIDVRNWVGSILLGLIIWRILYSIIDSFSSVGAKQALTHIALANGLVIGVGLSPNVDAARVLVGLAPALSNQLTGFVASLVDVATVLDLLLGTGWMWDKGRLPAAIAFWIAFGAGLIITVTPLLGVFAWVVAVLLSAFSEDTGF